MKPEGESTVEIELELPHKPEKVWRALTDPALLAQWLLPTVGLDLAPGASFIFKAQPVGGWDGTVNCRFVEIEPLRKLRYTWVVGDERGIDTVVTFTLQPTGKGTRLTLVHEGFKLPEQKGALGGTRYGWQLMQRKLVELLERTS
jgi:uncharacterized protein YndB with AHSA1/START domain